MAATDLFVADKRNGSDGCEGEEVEVEGPPAPDALHDAPSEPTSPSRLQALITRSLLAVSVTMVLALIGFEVWRARPVLATPAISTFGFGALAVASMSALYIFLARCVSRRAGVYAVLVLATMPAWFVRARADGAFVALAVLSFACIGLAALDTRLALRLRLGVIAVAVACGVFGAQTFGLVVLLGIPLVAMGGMGFLAQTSHDSDPDSRVPTLRHPRIVSVGLLAVGGVIVLAALIASRTEERGGTVVFLTSLLGPRSSSSAPAVGQAGGAGFAMLVPRVVYALVPWTPLLPFAMVVVSARNKATRSTTTPSDAAAHAAQVAIILVAVLTLASEAMLQTTRHSAGAVGTLSCGALAAAVGVMLGGQKQDKHDPDHPAQAQVRTHAHDQPSALFAVGVLAIGALLAHDLSLNPDRLLDVLAAGLPTGHALQTAHMARVALWIASGATTIALLVDPAWLRIGSFRIDRSLIIIAFGFAPGLVLRAHTYPDLIARISPGRAVEVWADRRKEGDELGFLGIDTQRWPGLNGNGNGNGNGSANANMLKDPESASRWLTEAIPASQRRFLAIGPSELPRANFFYRMKTAQNVPVIAGGGAFLLGVSSLASDERSENPLDAIVMSAPPADLHAVSSSVGETNTPTQLEALDVLGWEILDARGGRLNAMPARKSAHLRIALRIGTAGNSPSTMMNGDADASPRAHASMIPLTGYCTFLHIDHTPTRFGAEHREHAYPMSLWREGDVVIDDFTIDLPPHFSAGNSYAAYWGVGVLPCQDDRRMKIVSGANDGSHRVVLGRVEVR